MCFDDFLLPSSFLSQQWIHFLFLHFTSKLFDRISSQVVSPSSRPPGDAIHRCRDAVDAIQSATSHKYSRDRAELIHLLGSPHIQVSACINFLIRFMPSTKSSAPQQFSWEIYYFMKMWHERWKHGACNFAKKYKWFMTFSFVVFSRREIPSLLLIELWFKTSPLNSFRVGGFFFSPPKEAFLSFSSGKLFPSNNGKIAKFSIGKIQSSKSSMQIELFHLKFDFTVNFKFVNNLISL